MSTYNYEAEAREKDFNPTLDPGAGGGGGRVREGREGGKGGEVQGDWDLGVGLSRRRKRARARSGAECAEEVPTALVDSWWRPVSDSALDREPRDQSILLVGRSRGSRDVKISVSSSLCCHSVDQPSSPLRSSKMTPRSPTRSEACVADREQTVHGGHSS